MRVLHLFLPNAAGAPFPPRGPTRNYGSVVPGTVYGSDEGRDVSTSSASSLSETWVSEDHTRREILIRQPRVFGPRLRTPACTRRAQRRRALWTAHPRRLPRQ